MSSRTKVSKQVKVIQGNRIVVFELTKKGLSIEYGQVGEGSSHEGAFTLGKPGMDALRELLGMQQPSRAKALTPDKPLSLPPEEFDERFEQGQAVTREPEGTPTPEGLNRKADGVEEGMGE